MTKIYGRSITYPIGTYSPARIMGAARTPMHGSLYQQDQICTSHVERHNGSIRHFMRRMTRLTCAFSKRWGNHRAALAIFFCHYNWCKKHRSLGGHTPAMAHGLADGVWTAKDLLLNVCA